MFPDAAWNISLWYVSETLQKGGGCASITLSFVIILS